VAAAVADNKPALEEINVLALLKAPRRRGRRRRSTCSGPAARTSIIRESPRQD
jgi:hypothetical protein